MYHQDTHGQAYKVIALNDRNHDDCLYRRSYYIHIAIATFSVSYLQVAVLLVLRKSHHHWNANQWMLFMCLARLVNKQ